MKLSVILSTYNSPEWLEKVLWGYSQQSFKDFEIVIADDGSGPETARLIESFKQETNLNILHVWHEDQGFRKCKILNKAILAASADYLVFSDGDCIPRCDFLAVHAAEAQQATYLSGGYHKLPMATSRSIDREAIITGRCFDYLWLIKNGMKVSRKDLKLIARGKCAQLLNYLTPTKCNFKGSNASAWKADVLKINGFDERMGWGGEDRELGVRLQNIGIRPKHVRYNAVVIHLDHPRGYVDPQVVKANLNIRRESERNKSVKTTYGIGS